MLEILSGQSTGEGINVQCTVCDSISKEPIPYLQVKFENLNKSFTTKRSAFYLSLPPGKYDIVLDAPDYETLKKNITVSATDNNFTLEMVKIADRKKIVEQHHKFVACLDSFCYLLRNMDIPVARQMLSVLQDFGKYGLNIDEKIIQEYYLTEKKWVDSLMTLARKNEDSAKYVEAFYYYRKIVEYDSSQIEALNRMHRMDSLLLAKNKPQTAGKTEQVAKKFKTPEEIEALYKSGVTKFINAEYKEALKIFKEVLKYNPEHSKAQEYLKRTEARIKILQDK